MHEQIQYTMSRSLQLCCLFLNILSVFSYDYDCCEYKDFGEDHTMCKYPLSAKGCKVLERGFTQEQKDEILHHHNTLRQKVAKGGRPQPTASNMMELIWNSEAERIAQRWTDQCILGHDKNRKPRQYASSGQNGFIRVPGSAPPSTPVNASGPPQEWFDEEEKNGFCDEEIKSFPAYYETAHYSAVIWAETKAVGCGYNLHKKDGRYVRLVYCNYVPGPNMVGGAVYKIGKPCSQCADGCSLVYPGLCRNNDTDGAVESPIVEIQVSSLMIGFYILLPLFLY